VSEHHPVLVWKSLDVHKCKRKQVFGGAKDFTRIFPNLPERFCGTLPAKCLHKDQRSWKPFLVSPPKKAFVCFSGNVGCRFLKSNHVGRHFCPHFQQCTQIFDKSKLLGVQAYLRLLYHWMYCNLNVCYFLWCGIFCLSICAQITTTQWQRNEIWISTGSILKYPLHSYNYNFVKPLICSCTKLWRKKVTSDMKSSLWNYSKFVEKVETTKCVYTCVILICKIKLKLPKSLIEISSLAHLPDVATLVKKYQKQNPECILRSSCE